MAKAEMVRQWPDEDLIRLTVESDLDSVAEVVAAAVKGYADALGVTMAEGREDVDG